MKISKLVTKFQYFLEIFYKNKHIIIHAMKIDRYFTISYELYTSEEFIMKPKLINIWRMIEILNYTTTFAICLF